MSELSLPLPESPQHIRDLCIDEASATVRGIILQAEDAADCNAASLQYTMRDLSIVAAYAGDESSAAYYADELARVSVGGSQTALAEAYWHGDAAGDSVAFRKLDKMLLAEQEKIAEQPGEHLLGVLPPTTLLDVVVQQCIDANMPADGWIAQYAIDERHTWRRMVNYYDTLLVRRDPEDLAVHVKLHELSQQLLGDPAFDERFVQFNTSRALAITSNPDLKHRLLEHFMRNAEPVADLNAFEETVRVAHHALKTSDAGTAMRDFFDQLISAQAEALREDGAKPFAIAWREMPWRMARVAEDGSAQELVDVAEMCAFELHALAKKPRDVRDIKPKICNLLGDYAEAAAARGDLAAAGKILAAIDDPSALRRTFGRCLSCVPDLGDLQRLAPDAAALAADPRLGFKFEIAELSLAGDTDTLAAQTLAYAEALEKADDFALAQFVRVAREVALADARKGLQLAHQLANVLRNKGASYEFTSSLSRVIAAAGDESEYARMYHDIHERAPSDSTKLERLAGLARKLGTIQAPPTLVGASA